ncbi:hypothetical protein PPL_04038 [Heterostelium album PN500]|uniref:beta-glucosidase n=1 Tax=Heterostelium pallidum (strain ATCC 26659 / Pp 5 / PN500) TaxID=670386 RepID=D3B5V0_HETP5|nr:hypothetical protein PPL_04038 [Heterostelium album PN500]EFA83248.1 hypothetical protein PPL_04038 [Heterostelium album PN500]|eukprot:XP_020435365.1 hypothetical protein PPL_04038 [Heterostelium album PN500]
MMKIVLLSLLLVSFVAFAIAATEKVNINNQPYSYGEEDDEPIYKQKKYKISEMYPKPELTEQQKQYIKNRDDFVTALLGKMSIVEKVGQMTQIDVNKLVYPNTVQLNETYVDEITKEFQIGSFLNSPTTGGIVQGYSSLNATQWIDLLTTLQRITVKNQPNSIPMIYGIDSIHGGTYIEKSTLFPHGTGMGATFNPDLVYQGQTISGKDSAACGFPWVFSPVLGLGVQPMWSRMYETFSEDPFVASQLGEASVRGLQRDSNPFTGNISSPAVVGTAKHYFGYSNPVNGKDRTPAWIPERMMRHYFLPSFAQALNKGFAGTVMVNSAEINGIPMHASEKYIAGVLREELQFDGLAVSDWQDIEKLHFFHKIAPTMVQAIELALNAGIDMSMVADDFSFPRLLLRMVQNGRIPESRLDMSVRRILNLKYATGLFDNPYPVTDPELIESIGQLEDREVAANAVAESVTLLQNNQVLPLNPSQISKILVTGPSADSLPNQNGGWTFHWQGAKYNSEFPFGTTILSGIQQYLNQTNAEVVFEQGTEYGVINQTLLEQAANAASESDAVVVVLGELPESEGAGDINDLSMDEAQVFLLETLVQSTKAPIILVLIEARPRVLPPALVAQLGAVLMAYLPGSEAGKPIAEIIFGDINPSGRLPITYPASTGDISPYYYKYSMEGIHTPLFDFGHGLSYTQFEYSDINCNATRFGPTNFTGNVGDYVRISVSITNVGKMTGKETAMLFLGKEYAQITPEVRMLKGFRKILLNPGDSQRVDFVLTPREFTFIGIDNQITAETGQFFINIGSQSMTYYLA